MRSSWKARRFKAPRMPVLTGRPVLLLSAALACAAASVPAQARLGEDFDAYARKLAKNFAPAGKTTAAAGIEYQYSLRADPQQQQVSPGYAVRLLVAVQNGKVLGQQMIVHPGTNPLVGSAFAAANGFAFAYEALGKPMPAEKARVASEFQVFQQAVNQAFLGKAQNIRYPGYAGLITLMRDNTGNLAIAATLAPPAAQAPAATPAGSALFPPGKPLPGK